MTFGELDRFLVPLDSPAARRYFNDALYVPHGLAGRIRRAVRRPPFRRATSIDGAAHLFALHGGDPRDFIILRDYAASTRGRVVAFAFTASAETPVAVVKAQYAPAGISSLRGEADALTHLQATLPPILGSTIPRVLRSETSREGELLVTSALPGRPAYVDMQGSLAPWRHIDVHFDAAARWLSAFHEATKSATSEEEVDGTSVPMTAVHGDYWPRNLLRDRAGGVGVVDWEAFDRAGSPFVDLFHYALTYGISYPFRGYRRVDPELAFAKTFLDRTHVSRAVRRYLLTYTRKRDLPPRLLAPAFRRFIETRGTMRDGATAAPGTAELPWARFAAMERASPAAFAS